MQIEQVNWTGQAIEHFVIEELICDGPFSWVYKARPRSSEASETPSSQYVALKISKPDQALDAWDAETIFPTQALAGWLGGLSTIKPDAAQLLLLQSEKLKTKCEQLVAVGDVFCEEDQCIVQMEWLEGMTLREVMNAGSLPLSHVLDLAQALDSLAFSEQFTYHGDVKPDNIMVTASGIKLLDPGHFGALDSDQGVLDNCMVTTPSYYPLLTPDDLLAVGIICWEAACGAHPMDGMTDSQSMDVSGASEDLYAFVRNRELVGEHFFTPILQAVRPSITRPGMPAAMEDFLLTAMRLKLADTTLDLAAGFASFAEMIAALRSLQDAGIYEL